MPLVRSDYQVTLYRGIDETYHVRCWLGPNAGSIFSVKIAEPFSIVNTRSGYRARATIRAPLETVAPFQKQVGPHAGFLGEKKLFGFYRWSLRLSTDNIV